MCAKVCELISFIFIVFGVGLITLADPSDENTWWARRKGDIVKILPWKWLQRRYAVTQILLLIGGALGIASMILAW